MPTKRELKQQFYSTMTMKEKERVRWRRRAQQGDAYEMEGAFGDTVYLPKVKSDVDPGNVRRENELRKRSLKRYIREQKKHRVERG